MEDSLQNFKRKRHTVDEKLDYVKRFKTSDSTIPQFCVENLLPQDAFKKCLNTKTLEKLEKSEDKSVKRALKPTGPRFPEIEQSVKDLFDKKRELGLKVKTADLQKDALEISLRDQISNFKARKQWAYDFKKRNEICWKKISNFKVKTDNLF